MNGPPIWNLKGLHVALVAHWPWPISLYSSSDAPLEKFLKQNKGGATRKEKPDTTWPWWNHNGMGFRPRKRILFIIETWESFICVISSKKSCIYYSTLKIYPVFTQYPHFTMKSYPQHMWAGPKPYPQHLWLPRALLDPPGPVHGKDRAYGLKRRKSIFNFSTAISITTVGFL